MRKDNSCWQCLWTKITFKPSSYQCPSHHSAQYENAQNRQNNFLHSSRCALTVISFQQLCHTCPCHPNSVVVFDNVYFIPQGLANEERVGITSRKLGLHPGCSPVRHGPDRGGTDGIVHLAAKPPYPHARLINIIADGFQTQTLD